MQAPSFRSSARSIQLPYLFIACAVMALLLSPFAGAQAGQTIQVASGDVAGLITAIQTLNANGGGTIDLASGGTYSVTAPSDWWYGPNAFPAISSAITINGNGATISRAAGSPKFRFFHVSGGFSTLPAGSLSLNNLTLTGGLAQGGSGGFSSIFGNSGGGGAGMGGAIYNQGTISLNQVTFASNEALGGSGGGICTNLQDPCSQGGTSSGGGGLGGDGGTGVVTGDSPAGSGGGFRYNGGSNGGGFLGTEGGSPAVGGTSIYGGNGGASNPSGDGGGGGGGGYGPGQPGGTGVGHETGGIGAYGAGNGGGSSYPGDFSCGSGGGGAFGGGGGSDGDGNGACSSGNSSIPGYGGAGGIGGGGAVGNYGSGSGGYGGGGAGWNSCECYGGNNYQCGKEAGGFGGGAGANRCQEFGGTPPSAGFGAAGSSGPFTDYDLSQGGGGAGMGGAVFNQLGSVVVTESTFTSNSAVGGANGTTAYGLGGAIFNLNGTVTLADDTFTGNTSANNNGSTATGSSFYNLSHSGGAINSSQTPAANLTLVNTALSTTNNALVNNQVNGTATVSTLTGAYILASQYSYAFGNLNAGYFTSLPPIVISNLGNQALTLGSSNMQLTGGFQFVSTTCNAIAAGSSCQIQLAVQPATAGAFSGTLTITGTGITNSPVNMSFTATGVVQSVSVGSSVSSQPVLVTFTKAGQWTFQNAVTMGLTGADYKLADFGNCVSGGNYQVGSSCYVHVTFSPQAVGTRNGAVWVDDVNGNILATAWLPGIGLAPQIAYGNPNLVTVATTASSGLNTPAGVAMDAAGNLFFADTLTDQVKELSAGSGYTSVSTIAGGFNGPTGIAMDGEGNIFVADTQNNAIKEILHYPFPVYSTVVTVGSGFSGPEGVAVDGAGNVFVSDTGNGMIKELKPSNLYSTVINIASMPGTPQGLAVDANENIFVANTQHQVVDEILAAGGYITINQVYGTSLSIPKAVALDAAGNVYVTDSVNATIIELLASSGYSTTKTLTTNPGGISYPQWVTIDAGGNVFFSDAEFFSQQIYELNYSTTPAFNFATSTPLNTVDTTDGSMTATLTNVGNQPLEFFTPSSGSNPSYPSNFPENTSDSNLCASSVSVSPGSSCDISANFMPTAAGANSGSIILTDNVLNASNATQTIAASGSGYSTAVNTTTSLASALNPSTYGQQVTVVATVTAASNPVTSGSVQFSLDGSPVSTQALNGSGQASAFLTGMAVGSHSVVAAYTPADPNSFNASVSPALMQTVNQASQAITFTPPTSPVIYPGTSPITLSATGGASGNPVTFGILFGPGSLSGTNNSLLTVTGTGTIMIAANQAGNTNYSAAPQVTQSVVVNAPTAAALTSPASGSTFTGTSVTFTWGAVSGATQYGFRLGTTPGGNNIFGTGQTTATSATASGLPTNGETIYATLYTFYGSTQLANSYTFTAATPAALTSPAPSSVLNGPNLTFTWGAVTGATQYAFRLGTTPGANNLFASGQISATSSTVAGLPTNGEAIYGTLYTYFGSAQGANSYTFTASTQAAITSPTPNSVLTGPTVTFTWGSVPGATQYGLRLGTTPGGNNIFGSGLITATSATATGLPTNGETIYATLYTAYGSVQVASSYTFTAATPAALTSPAPNSVLTGPNLTFTWGAVTGATQYAFRLGTTPGANNLFASGQITATSATFAGLPTNGETIYGTLYTYFGSAQGANSYTFTASTQAAITSPTPNSVFTGTTVTFNWSAATGATQYGLRLGTTPGANNLFGTGLITGTSATATGLPANGQPIYATLYTAYGSVEVASSYTFTAYNQ